MKNALTAEQALSAKLGDGAVEDCVAALASKVGENVQLKRARRLSVDSGVAGGYVHAGGKLAVVVGLSTAGSGEQLETLAKDIAMHVAAIDPTPLAVDRESLPAEGVSKEREFLKKQALDSGKPESIADKMVDGRMKKFYRSTACSSRRSSRTPIAPSNSFSRRPVARWARTSR